MKNMMEESERNASGVYRITSLINGMSYIGSSQNMRIRANEHRSKLRRGVHPCQPLQIHVNEHGLDTLAFCLIELCSIQTVIEREQYYLDFMPAGFNVSLKANAAARGHKHSAESIEKMVRNRVNGYPKLLPEQRKPATKPKRKGAHVWTDEQRKARSEAMKGNNFGHTRKITAETRRKLSEKQKKVAVNQYAANGAFLRAWDSATTARNELGISNKNIQTCCNGVREYAGGFKWQYAKKA